MLIIKLIFKNILIHKLRNLIIFLIIGLITTLLFLLLSFSDGEIENFRNGLMALQSPTPDVCVMNNNFYTVVKGKRMWQTSGQNSIRDYSKKKKKLLGFDFIRRVYMDTGMMYGDIYYNGDRFNNTQFKGMETGNDGQITERINLIEGRLPAEGDRYVLMLNIASAEAYRIRLNDTVTLLGKDFFGQAVAQDFKFIGYYRPKINHPSLNRLAFTDLKGHNVLSGLYEDETYVVNIDLKKGASLKGSLKKLHKWAIENGLDLKFMDYQEFNPENNQVYDTVRFILLAVCLIVILIISIGIVNVVSVNLHDRKKEIGTYYCIGAEKRLLLTLYSLEILIVNLASAVTGILLGLLIRYILNNIRISSADPGIQLVIGGDIFRLGFSASTIYWILSGILIITLVTALFSLRSSLRVSPTAAIREVE